MKEYASDIVIKADNAQIISAKGLREAQGITLQRTDHFEIPISYPIRFLKKSNGMNETFSDLPVNVWFIGTGPNDGDTLTEFFEITDVKPLD